MARMRELRLVQASVAASIEDTASEMYIKGKDWLIKNSLKMYIYITISTFTSVCTSVGVVVGGGGVPTLKFF